MDTHSVMLSSPMWRGRGRSHGRNFHYQSSPRVLLEWEEGILIVGTDTPALKGININIYVWLKEQWKTLWGHTTLWDISALSFSSPSLSVCLSLQPLPHCMSVFLHMCICMCIYKRYIYPVTHLQTKAPSFNKQQPYNRPLGGAVTLIIACSHFPIKYISGSNITETLQALHFWAKLSKLGETGKCTSCKVSSRFWCFTKNITLRDSFEEFLNLNGNHFSYTTNHSLS